MEVIKDFAKIVVKKKMLSVVIAMELFGFWISGFAFSRGFYFSSILFFIWSFIVAQIAGQGLIEREKIRRR